MTRGSGAEKNHPEGAKTKKTQCRLLRPREQVSMQADRVGSGEGHFPRGHSAPGQWEQNV